MALIFPLVLLSIFCVSAASARPESDDDIITSPRAGGDQPLSVLNLQQDDISSVLRDVRELKADVKHLLRQNEEQQQQNTHLQQQLEQQQQRNVEQQQQLEQQQQHNVDQQQQLEQQQHHIRSQAAELVTINARVNVTEEQVEALRTGREGWKVAFSASLRVAGGGLEGPFSTHRTLIFRGVIANIGNAYSAHTGLFTAPVRGAYHFELYIHGYGNRAHASAAWLVKNGHHVCSAHAYQPSNGVQTANGATLLLEAGDVVLARQWANTVIWDDNNIHTIFSGHLLFTM